MKIPAIESFDVVRGGDSPGDVTQFCEGHVHQVNALFSRVVEEISKCTDEKIVIAVAGGSGVGKSGVAALLSYYLNENNMKTYTLTGDNYPRRRPFLNDLERTNVFRSAGLKGLVASGQYSKEVHQTLTTMQQQEVDADRSKISEYAWLESYIEAAEVALSAYLGQPAEQDFEQLESILSQFKQGADNIMLKRMGREEFSTYYEEVDFSETKVLVLEWTHSLSKHLKSIDIPVLLCSTPEETLERRKRRNREGDQVDTAFISMVLKLEQQHINSRAYVAKILLSPEGELLTQKEVSSC